MLNAQQCPCRVKLFGEENRALATILQFNAWCFFLYHYPQHFGCKMCLDRPKQPACLMYSQNKSSCSSTKTSILVSGQLIPLGAFQQIPHLVLQKKKKKKVSRKVKKKMRKGRKCFQVYGQNVDSRRRHDAAMWGLVGLCPQRSKTLSHSSDIFLSRREPTVGISNFSNSTSL